MVIGKKFNWMIFVIFLKSQKLMTLGKALIKTNSKVLNYRNYKIETSDIWWKEVIDYQMILEKFILRN